MATTQVTRLPLLLSLTSHVCLFAFSRAAHTALYLGRGTLRPLDFCPEVYFGLGCLQSAFALVV
jgi:hypothetical protein